MGIVKIEMTDLDLRQETEPLIKSFFPLLKYCDKTGDEKTDLAVTISAHPDSFTIELFNDKAPEESLDFERCLISFVTENTEVSILKNEASDKSDSESNADRIEKEKADHRIYSNQMLRALYRLLSEYTGRSLPWGILTGVRPSKLIYERIERGEAGHLDYMAKNYYVSREKASLVTRVAAKEYQLLDKLGYKGGYSLYVGTPFCPSICNYCSFGSHPIGKYGALVEPYIQALLKEIEYAATCFPERKLQTIYFGGGTPTSLSAEDLKRVIDKVKEEFDISNVAEFTVEAGRPDSITVEKLNMLKNEGVDRISVNPQTMVQRTLDVIGRRHTVEQCVEAFNMARECGFDNINMDLIAGLSGENIDDFSETLRAIEKLDPESLTVHTLAHKRAAALTTHAEEYEGLEASGVSQMVDMAAKYAREHGYEPYYMYRQKNMTENLENVGYAKPGRESLYNILIMEEKQMILAVGAGASSKFVRDTAERFERVENVKSVVDYINRIDEMIERKRSYLYEHHIN